MKSPLSTILNITSGSIDGSPIVSRTLSELSESFADRRAYEAALKGGNPVIYTVTPVKPAEGDGQLHYGLGTILPGKIGNEYFLTKGHAHKRREAAEVYIGLKGKGVLLLENIQTGESSMHELGPNSVVYVPGFTAHRTANTGSEPFVYIGIYPADAGHDYEAIGKKNFRSVIIEQNGKPLMVERKDYLDSIKT
ncbi:MAG: glucose-6-phosphate isomerase family protein [Bacteroidota bacterium]